MRLYHTTTTRAAKAILRAGFRDKSGSSGVQNEKVFASYTGAWFANRPVGVREGAKGDPALGAPVLVIDLDEATIVTYEQNAVPEDHREWCIPAALANPHLLGVIHEPARSGLGKVWWEAMEPAR